MLTLTKDVAMFDIYPRVVPVGREVTFTLQALDPHYLQDYACTLSVYGINGGPKRPLMTDIPCEPLRAPQSGFRFSLTLPTEQEYLIFINFPDKQRSKKCVSVYALEDDLLARQPLAGDFHAHTFYSDGKEGPAFVAAEYRKNGFDFATVTDHRRMASSHLGVKALEGLDTPFVLYHGEEVHPHAIHQHVVNFASDNSANEFALREKTLETWGNTDASPEWEAEIERVKATLTDLPEDVERTEVASAMIVSKIIREGGGMAILAHPHWLWPVHNVADPTTRYMLKAGIFDALELVGGMRWDEQQTQIAFYEQLCAEGINIPVVGSSDMHSCLNHPAPADQVHYFTEERTVVFAKSNTREDIIQAVKDGYSTTIYMPVGNYPQICGGSYRMKCYANFLMREYFPRHEARCFTEGCLMHDYLAGVVGAKEQLEALAAYNKALESRYFYR